MLPRSAVRATQVLCLITNISAHCCIAPTLLLPPHFSFPKARPATLPVELLLFSTAMRWVESEPQPLILWKQDPFSSGAGRKRGVQPGASGNACGYSHTSHRQGEGIPIFQRSKRGKGKHLIQQFLPQRSFRWNFSLIWPSSWPVWREGWRTTTLNYCLIITAISSGR